MFLLLFLLSCSVWDEEVSGHKSNEPITLDNYRYGGSINQDTNYFQPYMDMNTSYSDNRNEKEPIVIDLINKSDKEIKNGFNRLAKELKINITFKQVIENIRDKFESKQEKEEAILTLIKKINNSEQANLLLHLILVEEMNHKDDLKSKVGEVLERFKVKTKNGFYPEGTEIKDHFFGHNISNLELELNNNEELKTILEEIIDEYSIDKMTNAINYVVNLNPYLSNTFREILWIAFIHLPNKYQVRDDAEIKNSINLAKSAALQTIWGYRYDDGGCSNNILLRKELFINNVNMLPKISLGNEGINDKIKMILLNLRTQIAKNVVKNPDTIMCDSELLDPEKYIEFVEKYGYETNLRKINNDDYYDGNYLGYYSNDYLKEFKRRYNLDRVHKQLISANLDEKEFDSYLEANDNDNYFLLKFLLSKELIAIYLINKLGPL